MIALRRSNAPFQKTVLRCKKPVNAANSTKNQVLKRKEKSEAARKRKF